jgi:anti-anti-sigma factor
MRFIDSTEVGLLLTLQKKLHAAGRQFVLASVSPGVRRALALMRLRDHFDIAQDMAAAERVIAERTLEESASVIPRAAGGAGGLAWLGEITAANAEEVWNHTRHLLEGEGKPSPVAIDLSRARFIDSTGLTTMLRLQQWAWRQGTKIVFTGLQPPALDVVLRMAKLDQILLEKPELYGLIADSFSTS